MFYKPFVLALFFTLVYGYADWSGDTNADKWRKQAKANIDQVLKMKPNRNIAKNIIFFLGDGMGITTVTAGRILKGQLKGKNGEDEITVMESLDNAAFSKTYNIDAQTPDSAGTATAYLSGVKTRIGVIGVDGRAIYNNCKSSLGTNVDSILQWAHKAGKSVGIVTTTRITHATPAGAFAHIANRDWEVFDGKIFGQQHYNDGCRDAAAQLIDDHPYINVLFGGGRRFFLRDTDSDYLNSSLKGNRIDNRNLIQDWINNMTTNKLAHKFLWNATELKSLDASKVDHVLGLFAYDHMEFESRRNRTDEPSLAEMTEKAIQILSKNKNGYFILVEGGKIDHAHHNSNAYNALHDFVSFEDAIEKAVKITSKEDTMITVTADHSHVFTMGGYSLRGNPIFSLAYNAFGNLSSTQTTYTSLIYGNGPGGLRSIRTRNLTESEVESPDYLQESAVLLSSETHGGEDVPIYSSGPMSFLFQGTVEQSYIAHAMAYSACIGAYNNDECRTNRGYIESSGSSVTSTSFILLLSSCLLGFILN